MVWRSMYEVTLCPVTRLMVAERYLGDTFKQSHQLFYDVGCAVSMRICGFPLGMSLEDVVHHRKAEAAHQFAIELYMAVVHTVTKTMEVIKQMLCLLICQFDNGVLVQRDTATDAVVVRRQQVLKKLIISSKPFYLQVCMCRKVADSIRHRYHHR